MNTKCGILQNMSNGFMPLLSLYTAAFCPATFINCKYI